MQIPWTSPPSTKTLPGPTEWGGITGDSNPYPSDWARVYNPRAGGVTTVDPQGTPTATGLGERMAPRIDEITGKWYGYPQIPKTLGGGGDKAIPYPFKEASFTDPYLTENLSFLQKQAQAGQAQAIPLGAENQYRAQQLAFLDTLRKQSTGEAPSLAEAQYKAAQEQNLRAALAQQASLRGGNVGTQLRQAQTLQGQTSADIARQGALLRLQEQQQAQQLYSQSLASGRSADVASQQTLNQMVQYYTTQGLTLQQAQWKAMMDLEDLKAKQWATAYQTQAGIAAAEADREARVTGAAIGAGGAAIGSIIGGMMKSGGGG